MGGVGQGMGSDERGDSDPGDADAICDDDEHEHGYWHGYGSFGAGQQTNQWEEAQSSGSWNAEGSEWNDGGTGGVGVGETQDQGEVDGESAGPEKEDSPIPGERSVGSTGKMQKVGDRWVFVRS